MKRHYLIPYFLLSVFSLKAQQQQFELFRKNHPDKHRDFVNSLLSSQSGTYTAQKPTGLRQRVIAEISVSATYGVQDTMTYQYSGARGSTYSHNRIDNFGYIGYFQNEYLPGAYAEVNGLTNNVPADSAIQYDNDEPFTVLHAFYRPDNQIDSFYTYYEGGTATDIEKTTYTYNSGGRMTQYLNSNNFMNPPGFDTNALRRMVYNTAGTQLIRDTLYVQGINAAAPHYVTYYHYNTQNKLDSMAEYMHGSDSADLIRQTTITYDAGNRIHKIVQWQYSQSDTTIAIDTFGYTGSLPFFTFYEKRFQWANQISTRRMTKHVGSNNLPDSVVVYSELNGPLEVETILKYAYNSYNNPDSIIGVNPDGTYAGRYTFYYETYDDGNNVGIGDVAADNAFSTYPNPFGSTVRINWKHERTLATITLISMTGQTVFSSNKLLAKGNHNSIDLTGIPGGNYMLLIRDAKGNIYNSKLSKK